MNILREKQKLLPMGNFMGGLMGGGGGGGPSTSTSYQTNIPEYARPYVDTMLGATQKQLFQTQDVTNPETGQKSTEITGFQPYRAFGGTYDAQGNQTAYDPSKSVAGFTGLQTGAQTAARDMQVPGQFDAATMAAGQGIQQALGASQYQPYAFGNQYQAPPSYSTGIFGVQDVNAPSLSQYQMGPAERIRTQSFARPGAAEAYMSPYMQNVVDVQQREARRASDIARQSQQAQAVGQGAFGGSRQALIEAERQRNLATQLGDIQATGLNAAYNQAQQQFNAEQQARLAAQQANQQAGLTVGGQNLQALLGTQQLGAGQNLQAQLANQQAAQAAQQLAEQSRQYGYGQNMTAAQLAAQYGLAGQQATEQSRQFGANLGLQGAQAGIQGASQLAGIGQQQLAAQQGIIGLQNQIGAQQQAYNQQVINQAIQDYANAQQYPLMQLGTMSNMLRGLPMQAQTTNQYVAAPNPVTQGIGALGTYGALKSANVLAKGGEVKSMAAGGIASYGVGGEIESQLASMDEENLKRQAESSSSPTVRRMAQRLLREKQMEKSQGVGPVGPMGVDYQAAPVQAARGGILAFTAGGDKKDAEERDYSVLSDSDFPKEPEKEIQTSDSSGMSKLPERGIGPVARDVGRSILRGIKGAVERPAPTSFVPKGSDDNYEIPQKTEAAPRRDFVKQEAGTVTRTPAEKAEQARLAAIYEAQRAAPTKTEAAPVRPAAPAAAPAGIAQVAPAPARAANAPEAGSQVPDFMKEALAESKKSIADIVKERNAAYTEAGIDPENKAAQEERARIMSERANLDDEAKRKKYLRAAEFFARWGSTPGNVLQAGMVALQKSLPDLITDENELKKAKRDLSKMAYDIDQAVRLEKKGNIDAAVKHKEKAADVGMHLQQTWMTSQATRYGADQQLKGSLAHAAAVGASAQSSRDIQKEDRAYKSIGVAQDDVRDVLKGIDKYKTSTEYTNAMRAIDAYNTQLKNKGEANVDKGVKNRYDAAQEKLYGKNGAMTRWNKQLEAAEQDVKNARSRWKDLGGKESSGSSVDNDPFKLR